MRFTTISNILSSAVPGAVRKVTFAGRSRFPLLNMVSVTDASGPSVTVYAVGSKPTAVQDYIYNTLQRSVSENSLISLSMITTSGVGTSICGISEDENLIVSGSSGSVSLSSVIGIRIG